MLNRMTTIPEIELELEIALRKTLSDLMQDFPNDKFYYFALTTVGEALSPGHSIWSEELLDIEAEKQSIKGNVDKEIIKNEIRYSYADSPLFYHYERHFKKVEKLFLNRPDINEFNDEDWEKEFELRITSMVNALKKVDKENLFGVGEKRENWFINVEVNPPDGSNILRAEKLNSKQKVQEWIDNGGE